MLNRDERAALARGVVTVLAGAAVWYAIARFVGWWAVGAIAIVAVADFAWCMSRLPARWRPW